MLKETIVNIFRRIVFTKDKISHGNSWDMSDIFIASYPKSGTTWLCLILANIIQELKGNSNRRVDFYSVHDYVPDFHFNPQKIDNIKPQRFIKTHELFNIWNNRIKVKGRGNVYPRVVYLVRDGKKSTISSLRYFNALSGDVDFSNFIKAERLSHGTWDDHVDGWLLSNNVVPRKMIHVVSYEDLVDNTYETIKSILDFSGLKVSQSIIRKSIKNSDISVMRKLEEKYGNGVVYADLDYKFARKGESRGASKELLREIDEYFSEGTPKVTLKKMGY
jgi:hypothetical protein